MAKVIAVLGATGGQGGGLCRAILADPSSGFSCRAVTRDPNKDKAKALAAAGAEVVAADLDDVESLKKAFAGAHGVFAVTNFWEHFSAEKEKAQAKNVAEAAKAAGVQHVIWSTLEDTRKWMPADDTRMPMLQGSYRVPHFDAKAEANAFFAGVPTTFLWTTFYWDNLYMFGLAPKKGEDGKYAWAFPLGNAKMAGIAVEDIGKCALGIFKGGSQYVGQTVGIMGEAISVEDMGKELTNQLGIGPVTYNAVDANTYRSWGFPGADEMGNMFQVYRDFEGPFLASRSVETAKTLNPALQNFSQWLSANKAKVPV
jgi:nucleoside-diphosphate-sugar epimerase